jgi:DNA polymerase-1
VEAKFGVGPERVIDVQALAGDSVDNVPGAPGIGVKTAALLINEYGDLDTLLARAEEIKQPKRRQTLIENADQIRLSRTLVTLDDHVPMEETLDDLEVLEPEAERLMAFLAEMEFRTLTKRIADSLGVDAPVIADTDPGGAAAESVAEAAPEFPAIDHDGYDIVRDLDTLQSWIDAAHARGVVAIDTETTSLNEMTAELVGVSLSVEPGRACYIPVGHVTGGGEDLFAEGATRVEGQIGLEACLSALKPLLEDDAVLKVLQNAKYDVKVLARYGIDVAPIDDTMLMSYAMNAGLHGHGMDALAERYLGHHPIPIKDLIGSGKAQITFDKVEIDKAAPYAAEDADVTLRLWHLFKPQLHRARVTTVYETLERPLGARPGADGTFRHQGGPRYAEPHVQRLCPEDGGAGGGDPRLAGETFNVGSPAQLGEILFEKMGLEGGKTGKTGKYSTPADVLEDLATTHDLPGRVLDWRQLSKLKSTYTDALQDHINAETGRVHTSYVISGANTGRLASTDPNLQNIPVRTEEGRRIREAFVAEPGKVLVSLDYSQIELRILAHIAGIDALKQAFKEGQDIHAATASEMFNVPLGRDDAGCAPAGQGDQFRRDLRHLGLWPRAEPAHPEGRGAGLHRPVFRAVPGHPRLHGRHQEFREIKRIRADALRAEDPHARDQRQGSGGRFRRAGRDQRADPGNGGRRDPAGHGADGGRDRRVAGGHAVAGA